MKLKRSIVYRRCEEKVPQANNAKDVDLERPGGVGERKQIQSHPQPHQHQEHQKRAAARQSLRRLQGTFNSHSFTATRHYPLLLDRSNFFNEYEMGPLVDRELFAQLVPNSVVYFQNTALAAIENHSAHA